MTGKIATQAVRFLVGGGINTAVTYLLYLALLPSIGYRLAYTAAFVAGIALSYVLNARFVFRARMSKQNAAAFPLVYVAQYLFGLAVLQAGVSWLSIPPEYASLLSIALSVPLTFVLSRFVFLRANADTAAPR